MVGQESGLCLFFRMYILFLTLHWTHCGMFLINDTNLLFCEISRERDRFVCQEKRRHNTWLFLGYTVTCRLVNYTRVGEPDMLTDWQCYQLCLLWLNQGKPLPFIPWIPVQSGCILYNLFPYSCAELNGDFKGRSTHTSL